MPSAKVAAGRRLDREDGRWLLTEAPLLELGALAQEARFARMPERRVTFVIDTNPNYTNVCITDCQFCAFYRKPGDPEAYTLTVDEVLARIESAARRGATTVLLQGGHNPRPPRAIPRPGPRDSAASPMPPFFTASGIQTMARSVACRRCVLVASRGRATHAPGGGAEVLSSRVRAASRPRRADQARARGAPLSPRRGFKSTATMMYGHVEQVNDVLEHWDIVRELQDGHGGISAFVPWSFKPGNTLLEKWIKHYQGPNMYLRMLAASRLYLDNFDHIQASWFSEGKRAGQIALHFGADDWGGTLFEENVHRAADYVNTIGVEEIIDLIRDAGFTPAQRTTEYEILHTYGECGADR
jgi:cyclic dehypoxanthinyl futalosine synthase